MRAILERAGVPAPAKGRSHRWIVASLTVLLAALITVDLRGNPGPDQLEAFRANERASIGGIGQVAGETTAANDGSFSADVVSPRDEVATSISDGTQPSLPQRAAGDPEQRSMTGMDSGTILANEAPQDSPIPYTPSVATTVGVNANLDAGAPKLALSLYEPPVSLNSTTGVESGPAPDCADTTNPSTCASSSRSTTSNRLPATRQDPIGFGATPLCSYFVIGMISGTSGSGSGSGFSRVGGSSPAMQRARALGADGVLDYRSTPIKDANNRVVGHSWEAIAIAFTDRRNSDCYR